MRIGEVVVFDDCFQSTRAMSRGVIDRGFFSLRPGLLQERTSVRAAS
jgi:hypothetical protein